MTDAECMGELADSLRESLSLLTASLMDDIDPEERRQHNRLTMDDLRERFGLPLPELH